MEQPKYQVLHNRYCIKSLLSRKAGRKTFLARDFQTGRLVILKLLLFSPDFTWDDLKLFEREAEVLRTLDHSAIPKYLDFFEPNIELGKGFALVQNYIDAQSLQTWIQSGRSFSEAELKWIAERLLDILHYLHSRQPPVIHRDIKPSNILLGDRSGATPGQIYLVDFGSVQTAAQEGTITVVGTYGYMPPEQFGGRALPKSDLYSLGMTLIYLATGQHPADLPQKDLRVEFEEPISLSRSFTQWIRWLTEPDLARRPTSAKDALHLLGKASAIFSGSVASSSSKRFVSLAIRYPSSNICLEVAPTTFKAKVPSSQIKILRLRRITLFMLSLNLLCPLIVFVIYNSLGFAIIVLASFLYLWLTYWLMNKPIESYDAVFSLDHNSLLVCLAPSNLKYVGLPGFTIVNAKLRSISVDLQRIKRAKLKIDFHTSLCKFYVTGSLEEIDWLCKELNEWAASNNITNLIS